MQTGTKIHGFPTAGDIYAYGATIETVENFCYLRSYIINHWELWARSQCVNRQSSWRFLKTRQIMEEQENQFASENKALWSTSPLHVAQQCRAVASLSHTNEKKLEAAHHRWQRSILGISWKDKVTNEKVRDNCTSKADADVWDGLDIFHEWITIDFCDKFWHGNPRVSGGGQVDRDRTGKMSSRMISGKWASAGMRLKRLRRTRGAGGIVSPNVSDTGWTRNTCGEGACFRGHAPVPMG